MQQRSGARARTVGTTRFASSPVCKAVARVLPTRRISGSLISRIGSSKFFSQRWEDPFAYNDRVFGSDVEDRCTVLFRYWPLPLTFRLFSIDCSRLRTVLLNHHLKDLGTHSNCLKNSSKEATLQIAV